MGYRSEAELDAIDDCEDEAPVRMHRRGGVKSTHIGVGGGRVWARIKDGWVEMGTGLRATCVTADDIVTHPGSLRRLTPAEVEHAERGLGPLFAPRELGAAMARCGLTLTPEERAPCPDGIVAGPGSIQTTAADEAQRAAYAEWHASTDAAPSCPCGGAGCRDVTDGALHQCGGPSEACAVPGCPECDAPIIAGSTAPAGLTPEQAQSPRDALWDRVDATRAAADAASDEWKASEAAAAEAWREEDEALRALTRASDRRRAADAAQGAAWARLSAAREAQGAALDALARERIERARRDAACASTEAR